MPAKKKEVYTELLLIQIHGGFGTFLVAKSRKLSCGLHPAKEVNAIKSSIDSITSDTSKYLIIWD